MTNEIVYVCNSINNKNVRGSELKYLKKFEKELCFEFGESRVNMKRRYYRDVETLNKDFEEVKKIKEKLEKEEATNNSKKENSNIEQTEKDKDSTKKSLF